MKERLREYIYGVAEELAAGHPAYAPEVNRISLLLREDPQECRNTLAQLLAAIADELVTPGSIKQIDLPEKLVRLQAQKGYPLLFLMERNRFVRLLLLERFQQEIASTLATPNEWQAFGDCQLRLIHIIDQLNLVMMNGYLQQETVSVVRETIPLPEKEWRMIEEAGQALIEVVLQSQDIGVIVVDKKYRIREANQAFAQLLPVNGDSVIGSHIEEVFHHNVEQRLLQGVIERGEYGHNVAEIYGKWMTFSTSPIYRNGQLWGALAVLRHVSESTFWEEELSRREALAAVGQLAAGMAHEIRNPLTSIKGFVQLLREQFANDKSSAYCSLILSEIERIDGLINDVLVLARYRDDQMQVVPFILAEELYGVIRLIEPEATRRGISIELDVPDNEWRIFGYPARMKQAILNIVKNSLEALEQKGNRIRIKMTAAFSQVVIAIEDNGPGLPEHVRKHLFVPFFTTKQEGTGLGLTTTRRIVEDHKGEISADNSTALGGARFEIRLPLYSP